MRNSSFAAKESRHVRVNSGKRLASLWKEIRPQQWTKNLFVVAPLLFSQNLFSLVAVERAFVAFVSFCLMSSSIYLFNDLKDLEQDRLHPKKRFRPLAAGDISGIAAWTLMTLLVLSSLTIGAILSPLFALALATYWLINSLYSAVLKHLVILDAFAVASGFLLRVIGGGVAIDVEVSHWILLCTSLVALFLAFTKRRHELGLLKLEAIAHRRVLKDYNVQFLDMMIGIVTAATVMSYALYTASDDTVQRFHTRGLLLTVPFVLYGIFRYLYLVYQKEDGGDPTESLLTDRPMLINLFLWAVTTAVVVYRVY